jgi:hypothetical protein
MLSSSILHRNDNVTIRGWHIQPRVAVLSICSNYQTAMKKNLLSRFFAPLVAVGVFAASTTQAQVLLEENFTFTGLITNNGWVGFSGTTNFISADVPKLTFPNLPSSSVGNSAGITNTGQDAYKLLASNNSTGDIYTSFLINVSTAGTGDYFYSLYSTNSSGGGYFTRVFTQTNSTGFSFGVSRAQSTNSLVSYETNVRSYNTTYLVVAKMSRAVGTSNDVVSLWVDPVLGGSETSPLLTNNSGADNTNSIAAVAFRQGTTTPGARVGNILVGTTWTSVTPSSAAGGPSITSFTPTVGPAGTAVTITGTNFTGATAVTFNGVAATIFTVNSPTQITATVPAGATTGPIAVTTPAGFNSSADSFTVPSATVTLPAQILEGATGTGTVTLTSAPPSDVVVSLVSSSPTDLVVPVSVTVAAGFTTADFEIQAPLDSTVDADAIVTVTPTATGFVGIPANITVKNIDVSTVALTSGGYTQSFTGFTSAATLPLGWSLTASVQTYGEWETSTTAGAKFNSATVEVFGYQHTGSTGVVQQVLTMRNETGAEINNLTVSYNGRMGVAANGRTPSYTVTVDGQTVTSLAYSTADGDNVARSASLSGLTIAPNQVFQIIWSSDGSTAGSPGSGSRRQIGISNVSVSPTAALLPPSVTSLAVPLATVSENSADVSANVTADGGSAITARGFVYSLTSVNADPAIGGTGVTNVVDPLTDLGAMNATLTGLAPSTEYSIKAYATNAQGTTYTTVQTFTTLAPAASFTGSYFNAFNNFTGPASLPGEWTATSSTGVQNYIGAWTSGSSSGGFYGGVSSPGVLGYTHTSSTGTLTVTLRLVNDTGAPITDLNVRYLGRVEQASNTRFPTWTVTVAGVTSPELAYTTEVGVDETKTAAITGLNIPEGETFSLTWVCDRGLPTGSSRRIGMANVVVSTSAIADPVVSVVGTLTAFSATEGNPSAAQTVSASGSSLNGDIVVTAPANYEVSTDGTNYASSVTLTANGGSVPSTTVYVRIAATAPLGNPAGLVTFASDGAASQTIAVTGTVSAAGGYDAWAASYSLTGADALPTADPDKDGLNNSNEYAFGTNPTVSNASLLSATTTGGNMTVTWIERDSGFTYAVQSTANLATTPFANDGSVSPSPSGSQAGVPTGYTRKQFTVPATGNKFFRVRATPN